MPAPTGPTWTNTLLFWTMIALGAAALVPSLIVPAWLERLAQVEMLRAREQQLAELRYRLEGVRRQLDHLEHDPAYVLRVAEREFGESIRIPARQHTPVAQGPHPDTPPLPPVRPRVTDDDLILPELDAYIRDALERYPVARLYVHPTTRPAMMALGVGMLLSAILLLGFMDSARPGPPRQRT